MSYYKDAQGGNLITNTQIKHGMAGGKVEDDYAIATNNSAVKAIALGSGESIKINSLIFHNTNSSNSYTVDVAICEANETSESHYWYWILHDFVLPPNTTFIAIDTTTPITMVDQYELRIAGASGAENNVSYVCSYEFSDA